MPYYIVDTRDRVAQKVTELADNPTDPRFVKLYASSAYKAICAAVGVEKMAQLQADDRYNWKRAFNILLEYCREDENWEPISYQDCSYRLNIPEDQYAFVMQYLAWYGDGRLRPKSIAILREWLDDYCVANDCTWDSLGIRKERQLTLKNF